MTDKPEIFITPGGLVKFTPTDETKRTVQSVVGSENTDLYLLFIEAYLALLLDSPIDKRKPPRVLKRFLKTLLADDPKKVIITFSSYADRILQTMNSTSDYTIAGEFLREMQGTPVFREYLHFTKTQDPACLTYVLSFLYFGKKMDFVDEDLRDTAFRDWLEIEQELDTLSIPSHITDALAIIMAQLIDKPCDTVLLPKHGPGSTAEGLLDPSDKLDNLSLPERDAYVFRSGSFGRTGLNRYALDGVPSTSEDPEAEFRLVYKNITAMRSIVMEPIIRMYLQQEVARWLIDAMTPVANQLIDFRDQTHNQEYAVIGSYLWDRDTIDLSAASDRIHVDLVRKVFPKGWLFYLLGTRTSVVNAGEQKVKLNKFAPMGSALCFPVQSLLFSSILILAYLMHANNKGLEDCLTKDMEGLHQVRDFIRKMHVEDLYLIPQPGFNSRYVRPRVFGDDLICDQQITDLVLILLTRLGLKVNSEKSFRGSSMFRESCGTYAYHGHDVTPFRFRIPHHRKTVDTKVFASLVDQANRAGDFGYVAVRSVYINYLKRCTLGGWVGKHQLFIPFTLNRDEFGILSTRRNNLSRRRWNHHLQREEHKVLRIQPRGGRKASPLMEEYAYNQWMRARIRGGSTEINFSVSRVRPSMTRFALGWTPVR
jgi:hypothetical protein